MENYSVTTATSGQGCLDAVNLNKPDLLLLDVMLPDINGVDICKIIKSNPKLASIYIFLISGFAIKSESISEGLELGADGYLIKPIKSRELLARIEESARIIHTEKALKKSEEEFHSLAESMPQIVWSTRADGWNIYFNQQWVDYTGLTLEESYGAGWNKPFHPDDQQRAWDAWQNAVNNNGTYSIEVRLRRFDGEYRWWLIRGVPKIGENDEILKWFGTCTDIEDIKKTQDELRETNEYLENLFNYANAPIIVWDTDFRITQFNNAFEKLSGLNASDVIGKKIDILFPKDKIDYSYELINKTAIGDRIHCR